jgi:hypothetical protein
MSSKALLFKLCCFDFPLLKGQSQDKVCLCKFCGYHCTMQQFVANQRNRFDSKIVKIIAF